MEAQLISLLSILTLRWDMPPHSAAEKISAGRKWRRGLREETWPGRLMLNMFAPLAECERELIVELRAPRKVRLQTGPVDLDASTAESRPFITIA